MHEFSLMADLMRKIETVAQENGSKKVIAVSVQLGPLSHISADHFRQHFDHASQGSVAAGAHLTIHALTDTADPSAQDIVLTSVEVEEPEDIPRVYPADGAGA